MTMSLFQKGWTPLYIACSSGHVECVQLLLQQDNIDINKVDGVSILIVFILIDT